MISNNHCHLNFLYLIHIQIKVYWETKYLMNMEKHKMLLREGKGILIKGHDSIWLYDFHTSMPPAGPLLSEFIRSAHSDGSGSALSTT